MRNQLTLRAALAALFCAGTLAVAQEGSKASPATAAKIAAAKLVEVRGDGAAAEKALRAALAEAVGQDQVLVRKELLSLLKRQGRTVEIGELLGPATASSGQDPLAELIGMLDRDLMSESVDICKRELGQLGGLIVPSLLAALPKFGPFGISNALDVLQPLDDPRIGPALAQLASISDPSVAAAIAARAQRMPAAVAVPLARQFAAPEQPVAVQLGALGALIQYESSAPTTRELALRVAADPTGAAQGPLLQRIEKVREPWADEVVQVVRSRGSAEVQGEALRILIARNPAMTEAEALRLVEGLPPMSLVQLAPQVAKAHPEWVHFGLLVVRAARASGEVNLDWGGMAWSWQWWRAPDESGRELLMMPWSTTEQLTHIQGACAKLVEGGWQVPEALDRQWLRLLPSSVSNDNPGFWQAFVKALPVAAEDRALAIASQLAPANAATLAFTAVGAERPWHRLCAQQLARSETSSAVSKAMLDRDWTGAPAEAVAVLADLAKRWPQNNSGGQLSWHSPLIGAFRRCRDLPASVILPLVEAGNVPAWEALVEREPQVALAFARETTEVRTELLWGLLPLLVDHGGPADVALAVWSLAHCTSADMAAYAAEVLPQFFAKHGRGHLEVIRQASLESPAFLQPLRLRIAIAAAKEARVDDLDALLAMLPTLHAECAGAMLGALVPQIRAEHAASLVRTAEALLAHPLVSKPYGDYQPADHTIPTLGSAEQLQVVLGLLERTGSPQALLVARRVLGNAQAPQQLRQQAARIAVAVAGAGQRSVLLEMLLVEDQDVVQVALLAPALRDDAEVLAARRAALLRTGAHLQDTERVINLFAPAARLQLAEAVLADAHYAEFTSDLAAWAVATIGRLKDPSRIALIQRAGRHPSSAVRAEVVKALGSTFVREAASPLIELLKDEAEGVRKAAQTALDELANYLDAKAKWEARLK